jgi:TIGR00255 family protein
MIRSMTAYGRAEETVGVKNIKVELKSVNSRYFDCSVKISKLYGFLEEKVKSYIQSCGVSRGKVDVYVGIDILEAVGTEILLDESYTRSYIDALCKLRDTFGLKDDITVMNVAQNREIFNVIRPEEDMEKDWQDILPVLESAIAQFNQMRVDEGENLKKDIVIKCGNIKEYATQIKELSSVGVEAYRQRLETKLRQVLADLDIELDGARILTECAVFADKTAVDEELVRLDSHFIAFEKIIAAKDPVGRKLDFLVQEMNREINTIGSKANDSNIAALVIDVKSELEKIREQIQNIE